MRDCDCGGTIVCRYSRLHRFWEHCVYSWTLLRHGWPYVGPIEAWRDWYVVTAPQEPTDRD